MDHGASPIGERVVALEQQVQFLHEGRQSAADTNKCILEKLESLDKKIDAVSTELVRYKGFVGGMVLVFTGIGILLTFFKTWVFSKFGIPV